MKPSEVKSSEGFFVLNIVGLRVAKRIEKTDSGFLDTNLTSFGSTRKPPVIGVRVRSVSRTPIVVVFSIHPSLRSGLLENRW
jgi:hypothetical protein